MAGVKEQQGQFVFGLDIGTRSIVGTVGYMKGDRFHVVGQRIKEHDTRAMVDGQIHDIGKVAETISQVKEMLEEDLHRELTDVCIAAAGRVLRTITVHAEQNFDSDKEVTKEDIYSLSTLGVEKAYEEFYSSDKKINGIKFYCVGYTAMRYFLNGYQISNLEGHNATNIGVDLIATFLPDDVVDGLYKAVEKAGLKVANLTLEPIAAIQVAIPEKFRMLNMALVDVGAGTSDICITKEGTITAYGMLPIAGDSLTDVLVQQYLVEFDTAEKIKRAAGSNETIEFTDVIGLPQTVSPEEVNSLLKPAVDKMTGQVAESIKELNGDKPVSAVFVVGGGGIVQGYTDTLAEKLEVVKERVVIRGQEVMQGITFDKEDAIRDSMMVTPIGICLSYYEQSNNFIFVEFNENHVKLYDNGKLTVADAAMQTQFPNEALFPQRGDALNFVVNGKNHIVRGNLGEAASIKINNESADMYSSVKNGDLIMVTPSTKGENASMLLGKLPELSEQMYVLVNGLRVELPKTATVNGQRENEFYEICEGDQIEIHNYYTVAEIAEIMDVFPGKDIKVNDTLAKKDTKVYEGFTVTWNLMDGPVADQTYEEMVERLEAEGDLESEEEKTTESISETDLQESSDKSQEETKDSGDVKANENVDEQNKNEINMEAVEQQTSEEASVEPEEIKSIMVIVNRQAVTMEGKSKYIYVDVFEYIHFDLKDSRGRAIVTTLNGKAAEYMEELNDGDIIEIYWKES